VQVVLRRNSKAKRSLRNVFDNRVDSFPAGLLDESTLEGEGSASQLSRATLDSERHPYSCRNVMGLQELGRLANGTTSESFGRYGSFQKKWSETFSSGWEEPIQQGAYSNEFESIGCRTCKRPRLHLDRADFPARKDLRPQAIRH
jgi:hypothetical protein